MSFRIEIQGRDSEEQMETLLFDVPRLFSGLSLGLFQVVLNLQSILSLAAGYSGSIGE
ncbi:hypothetical protein QNI16_10650 [Cytophagaceae bacterium YF14B1]|uniref:Uncharacterized protein n=1 Tax=Xanthocytophaga flava TaxID=3048013 RepID=A0AAE3QPV5_9BACT|nr:hypothetical protein [Xanthocytophaga flavus]MDJ1480941.1 hypothetical protein [Xanthocytophaga flavus]